MKSVKRAISTAIVDPLFGPLAPVYDAWTWAISLGSWRKWQLPALPHVEGPRVLELGCGPGHLVSAIAASGNTCYGLDNSMGMLKQAAKNAIKKRATVRLVRGCAQSLPFASSTFDTVVLCFSGMAWLPKVLAECRRVLGPSGLLLVVDEVSYPRSGLRTAFIKRALSLFDCEEDDATPHETPLLEAGFDVVVTDEPVGGDVVRLLLGTLPQA
jgi:ubiquinone/menaquinone biosynthesis C-methylase UbiE